MTTNTSNLTYALNIFADLIGMVLTVIIAMPVIGSVCYFVYLKLEELGVDVEGKKLVNQNLEKKGESLEHEIAGRKLINKLTELKIECKKKKIKRIYTAGSEQGMGN